MNLQDLVDAVFKKLTLTYGRDFLSRWEGIDLIDVKNDWAHELRGYENAPDSIKYALQNLPVRPPSVVEFRALCMRAPPPDVPQLKAPRADQARAKAAIDEARRRLRVNTNSQN
jgi:hypothetical protein